MKDVRDARRVAAGDRGSLERCVTSWSGAGGRRVSAIGPDAPPPGAEATATGVVNAPVMRHPATKKHHGDPRTQAMNQLPDTRTIKHLPTETRSRPSARRATPVLHFGHPDEAPATRHHR